MLCGAVPAGRGRACERLWWRARCACAAGVRASMPPLSARRPFLRAGQARLRAARRREAGGPAAAPRTWCRRLAPPRRPLYATHACARSSPVAPDIPSRPLSPSDQTSFHSRPFFLFSLSRSPTGHMGPSVLSVSAPAPSPLHPSSPSSPPSAEIAGALAPARAPLTFSQHRLPPRAPGC